MSDLTTVFESSMYDFDLYEDGSWAAWQDGAIIASGAFNSRDLSNLAEEALRLEQSRIGLYDNDRAGEQ